MEGGMEGEMDVDVEVLKQERQRGGMEMDEEGEKSEDEDERRGTRVGVRSGRMCVRKRAMRNTSSWLADLLARRRLGSRVMTIATITIILPLLSLFLLVPPITYIPCLACYCILLP